MFGALIAATTLVLAQGCPSVSEIVPTEQGRKDAEVWLQSWSSAGWRGVPASDQKFRMTVLGTLEEHGFEIRAWRTRTHWRVFSREFQANTVPNPHPLRHPNWRELPVSLATSAQIDEIWNDDCLWSTPRLRIDGSTGSKIVVPNKPTVADRISGAIVNYDLEHGEQVWLGHQAFTAGLPAKLATLALGHVAGSHRPA